MTAVAETGGCSQEAKACQPPREAGRGDERFSPTVCRKSPALLTPPFQTSDLWNRKRINPCCVKPPHLWSLVTAATGKELSSTQEVVASWSGAVCVLWACTAYMPP